MENKDLVVLQPLNEIDPTRCCALIPSFEAKVGDLATTVENGLCRVVYRFYNPDADVVCALSDAYDKDDVTAVYGKAWEAKA